MATIKGEITTLKNKDEIIKFPRTVSSAVYHDSMTLDKALDNLERAIGVLEGSESIDFDSYQLENVDELVSDTNENGNLVQYVQDLNTKIEANIVTLGLHEVGETTFDVPKGDIVINTTEIVMDEGTNAYISVHLSEAPSIKQVVRLSVDNEEACVLGNYELVFTHDNYGVDQDITVSAIHVPNRYTGDLANITLTSTIVEPVVVAVNINNLDLMAVETIEFELEECDVEVDGQITVGVNCSPQPCSNEFTYVINTPVGSGADIISVEALDNAISITGITEGSVTVTITAVDTEITDTLTVNVIPKSEINDEGSEE